MLRPLWSAASEAQHENQLLKRSEGKTHHVLQVWIPAHYEPYGRGVRSLGVWDVQSKELHTESAASSGVSAPRCIRWRDTKLAPRLKPMAYSGEDGWALATWSISSDRSEQSITWNGLARDCTRVV